MNSSFDIVVVGGGVAGTAAALAAARTGVRTLLVERDKFLGGTGYSGLLQHIGGLYLNSDAFPTETLNQGIVQEIVSLLKTLSPQKIVKKMGLVYVLPYSREDLLSVFNSLCRNEQTLTVLHNTAAISIEKTHGEITEIVMNRSGFSYRVSPKIVIDCSGNADVSAMAGASFELLPQDKLQMAGYMVRIKGIRDLDDTLSVKVPYYLLDGVKKHKISSSLRFSTFTRGDVPGEGYLKLSINDAGSIGRDKIAKENAFVVHHYLSNIVPAFQGSFIVDNSLRVLDREGRRVLGEYILTEEDVVSARKFDDGIAKNAWPIELWDKDKGPIYKYVNGDYYEIPFRSLKVKGVPNLLVAGRCISVSHEALGSTRVMGVCMKLGEQAGIAAAYKIMNGIYPQKLQEVLCPAL
jgi:hypothetical protein